MNHRVARRTVLESGCRKVVEAGRVRRAYLVCVAVALKTELPDLRANKHSWIVRAVRRVANCAAFCLHRRVLVNERPLLVRVTLQAGRVCARREPGLSGLESTVRVMAIRAFHSAFHHAMTKRHVELRTLLRVALQTELRLACA